MHKSKIQINARTGVLQKDDLALPCIIGKNGWVAADKGREGDAKTPLGAYHLRFGFYRPDRLSDRATFPQSALRFHALTKEDGWCDAPGDPAYNRFIRLPYPASHERLWREDRAYDIILVLSHNDSPPKAGLGSAVFIHLTQADGRPTLGCVALDPDDMAQLLPQIYTDMPVIISA